MSVQKWPTNLVIVRHGQSERNVLREAAKQSGQVEFFHGGLRDLDAPLTAYGHLQSRRTGEFLAQSYDFDAAFTSPHLRSRETLNSILQAWPQGIVTRLDERVREIEFGALDGLTWQGIKHKYPEEWARREREGKYWYRPPGGESRPDVGLRVKDFLGMLAREYRRKSVLVVCHSVVVLIFRRLLEHWDESQYLDIDARDEVLNCSITAYKYDTTCGSLQLERYNHICYSAEELPSMVPGSASAAGAEGESRK